MNIMFLAGFLLVILHGFSTSIDLVLSESDGIIIGRQTQFSYEYLG